MTIIKFKTKLHALDTYVIYHGIKAMPEIINAAAHSNSKYRSAA